MKIAETTSLVSKRLHLKLLTTIISTVFIAACQADNANAQAVTEPSELVQNPVRQSIGEVTKDMPFMGAFATAVATMKTNSSAPPESVEFRTSFQFWANTHGYFGPDDAPFATNFQGWTWGRDRRSQCLGYLQDPPYKFSDEEAQSECNQFFQKAHQEFIPDEYSVNIWGTCQHTDMSSEEAKRTTKFLPWHRFYLHYFERTLRKYSGDPNFALPYWNYFEFKAKNNSNLTLPPVTTLDISNVFFDSMRTVWLNEGRVFIDPENASAEEAFQHRDFAPFSNQLERVPHGMMHCAVGNGCSTATMGWVPVAGNDPIFYMHHANVDRLWQCWLDRKAKGATIDLNWAKANLNMPEEWYDITYDFVDENGNRVTHTIGDVFSPEFTPSYSNYNNCPKPLVSPALETLELTAEASSVQSFQLNDIDLASKPIVVEPQALPEASLESFADDPMTQGKAPGVYLILENIMVKDLPGFTYAVNISSKENPDRQERVTAFNFFGFGGHGHGHSHEDSQSLGTQVLYISDDLYKLNINSVDNILVHFVPVNPVTGAIIYDNDPSPITVEKLRIEVVN